MASIDDLGDLIRDRLFAAWLKDIGWTPETFDGFANGIPVEWARAMAEPPLSIPVSDWPRLLHGPRVLHKRLQRASVNGTDMDIEQRLAISRGQAKKGDPWAAALRKAKLTQNGLATKLGVSQTLLSLYRKGDRPIPRERADKVASLIAWPVTAKNWPGGILEE